MRTRVELDFVGGGWVDGGGPVSDEHHAGLELFEQGRSAGEASPGRLQGKRQLSMRSSQPLCRRQQQRRPSCCSKASEPDPGSCLWGGQARPPIEQDQWEALGLDQPFGGAQGFQCASCAHPQDAIEIYAETLRGRWIEGVRTVDPAREFTPGGERRQQREEQRGTPRRRCTADLAQRSEREATSQQAIDRLAANRQSARFFSILHR